ncbi:HAD family hydrolase [Aureimonas sp. Leaf454]|uniref:HAD-IA family hydrolase n=1 Tax=Aureimonas sp. Leaf454 TaxID=1736381 RepID=UPI0006FF21E9|nr:HAD-IA family hydrolase [Aureimonas sp. Leaf454]KQT48670.1 HAD family hydrolase [Aureimonas sp. Leaf454]
MNLILFDCDGTIADSFGLICETMRRTFVANGFEPPADAAVHAIIGLSLDRAIHRLRPSVPPSELPVLVEAYRTAFRAVRDEASFREALFPGIQELLSRLRVAEGVRLGMVTGKTRRGVDAIVASHDLGGFFSAVRTADDCPSKPDPAMVLECCAALSIAPERTLVVGDAIFDMAMARAAGACALGVTWGAGTAPELRRAGAEAVADSVDDLGLRIDRWLAGELETRFVRTAELVP